MTAADADAVQALPPGTRFGELEVLGTLGVGGFGIVYLARDHALEREVAIKEYMPSQFALRDGRSQVSVRSISMRETFELGRRSFVNEARLLARFDHPSLLKVYRFWEANGTAYMAMPRLVGQNLREALKAQPTPPPAAWARRVFDAVLSGLEALHAQQVWHRDVAPDNIFLPADVNGETGPPILLDFGAARQAIGDRTQSFTAILKPSFAPIEQYAEAASLRQGPWTDFYALAAVMHQMLTGQPPQPATARAMGDELLPLALPGYSPAFLAGLDWALRLPPHQRPQTAAAWRRVLDGDEPVPPALPAPPRRAPPPTAAPATSSRIDIEFADTVQGPPPERPAPVSGGVRGLSRRGMAAAAATALLLIGLFAAQLRPRPSEAPVPPPSVLASAAGEAGPAVAAPASVVAAAPTPASAPANPAASGAARSATGAAPGSASGPTPVAGAGAAPAPMRAGSGADVAGAAGVPPAGLSTSSSARPRTGPNGAASAATGAAARPPRHHEVITERAGDFRPVAPAAIPSAPAVIAPAVAPAASTVAPLAPPEEARSPSEACGKRILLARVWCIDRQCERPLFRDHPECVKLREIRNGPGAAP